MAGLLKRGGKYSVRYVNERGERRTIALGTSSERVASGLLLKIEQLVAAKKTGAPLDGETAVWLSKAADSFRRRLEKVGLIESQGGDNAGPRRLGPFLEDYISRRNDVKSATVVNWRHARRCLLAFFGEERTLMSITAGDARDFERYLKTGAREHRYADKSAEDGLSGDTVRKRIANAKQFFGDAVAHGYIAKNPFADLKSTLKGNRSRDYFVTREEAQKVLDACPNGRWRLIFALARFGGLRIPSELFALKWSDIHWDDGKMTVHSPKTEHHEGKESRLVPIFPELRPYLEDARELAEPKAEYVIVRGRAKSDNLRTHLQRIIKRAGLLPWPKLFANLRSSRATELAEIFPGHVAAAFLGHSTQTAHKHYWQVTDEHFAQAAGERSISAPVSLRNDSLGARMSGLEPHKPAGFRGFPNGVQNGMGGTGLEPVTSTV